VRALDNTGVPPSGDQLAAAARRLPALEGLLPELEGSDACYLVGGALRDLMRGVEPVDIDLAVEGDASELARRLAHALGGATGLHERFGTATLVLADGRVFDFASTRRERYERPGALPVVEPAPLVEDLARRDFTINATALGLAGPDRWVFADPHGGAADLELGLVRVLHERSFRDDPTRLLRALRYSARLGFVLEDDTARLFAQAVEAGAPRTVSPTRIGDELLDLLAEDEAPSAVALLAETGLAGALHPELVADPELVAAAKRGSLQTGASPALAALAAACGSAAGALEGFIDELGLPRGTREVVRRAAARGPGLARELDRDRSLAELHDLLAPEPAETLAVALAFGAPAGPVRRFADSLMTVGLEITGTDLIGAGVPQSPAIGRALEETLRRKLDGVVSGREQELALALELARNRERET